jgi:hypothetical protein
MKKLLVILAVCLVSCTNIEREESTNSPDTKSYPDQELWESIIFITQNAQKIAEVWAGYIAFYNQKEVAVLKDSIHIDFYNAEGNHNSVLIADSGIVDNRTNNLIATGNVRVVSDSGIVLETTVLKWDNKKEK